MRSQWVIDLPESLESFKQPTHAVACPSGGAFRYHRLCLVLVRSTPPNNKDSSAVTAADIAQPGTVLVFVFNPPEGGGTTFSGAIGPTSTTLCGSKNSNGVSFTVKP